MVEERTYAVLAETTDVDCETWLYFLRWEGNEDVLRQLYLDLNSIDIYLLQDMSTFDLDIDNRVSETTAREMCKIIVNRSAFNRKFDGKMQPIPLSKMYSMKDTESKIIALNEILGNMGISEYIIDEEIWDENECSYVNI